MISFFTTLIVVYSVTYHGPTYSVAHVLHHHTSKRVTCHAMVMYPLPTPKMESLQTHTILHPIEML